MSINKKVLVTVSMRRRIEVWRPIKNLTPKQFKDTKEFALIDGTETALIEVDVSEVALLLDTITDAGLDYLCEVVGNPTQPARMGYTAIGTGAIGGTADSGTTTTTVDAERTEVDDYWNDAYILFTSGPNIGLSRKITDFVAATDTITHEAFPAAVAAGHTYLLSARPASTTLITESMRVANTYTKDAPVGEASLDSTFNITLTLALNECALLNAAAAGTMLCGDVYAVKNVVSGDTVKVYYTEKHQRP